MSTWAQVPPPPKTRLDAWGWARALARLAVLGGVVYGGLAVFLVLRGAEMALASGRRALTPYLTQAVCKAALVVIGLPVQRQGTPMRHIGAVVANHASWLDIFVLNACQRVQFVAKAEVAGWAGIGWLARATGTLFIRRDPAEARAQQALLEERIRAGHHLLFFPEGTSTDGLRVLPFKSTLFAAFHAHGLDKVMQIQPVSVIYHAPPGADPRFYGWWADMGFADHMLKLLAAPRQGRVEVIFHAPLDVADFPNRKALARACEAAVRAPFPPIPEGY
ncbi:lysophospholipid acyltransferase family protein [Phaeovulum vinaykumarii]|uniref:Lyso-ornithine lipid acyltransferase n=1 Tax=Phaeovulum vinaykumarii TaxID=407234 RepID=A0A1N7MEC2_9RHOB|nr:lysophospholipid acyltransferase family protein [Phaeovulum vinaykumarii]SIS84433.1 lyso-ornithine lipid acyltransferase [Phaeovulum vinaykumarii]SOC11767.1 lyso-ornithine lipid acyltransferase [Phaeovulum vinaykumarii]